GVFKIREVPECGIENFHAEARSLEISRKIEDSERRIGLHHALLDEVVLQKIGMTQQNVCHFRNPVGAGISVQWFTTETATLKNLRSRAAGIGTTDSQQTEFPKAPHKNPVCIAMRPVSLEHRFASVSA